MTGWKGLGEPHAMNLVNACALVEAAFNETPYLVGSAAGIKREYRDVDVRVILNDDKYVALFGEGPRQCSPFFNLICCGVSSWLAGVTGLPIDFQVQRRSQVSDEDWEAHREPLSLHHNQAPPWAATRGT